MHQVIQQLERARRMARLMLVAQQLMQWTTVLLLVVLACGVADYLLRLPGWLRLVVDTAVVAMAGSWLCGRLRQAVRFRPTLSTIALRIEKLQPQLAGLLASSVEFTANAREYANPRTSIMTDAAVEDAKRRLNGQRMRGILKLGRTLRIAALFGVVLGASGSTIAAVPGQSSIALRRWLQPLGDTTWPRRTSVVSLTNQKVWPDDTPLPLEARVEQGYRDGMRVWAVTRLIDADGDHGAVQTMWMTPQPNKGQAFRHEVDWKAIADGSGRSTQHRRWTRVEFYFWAGDDRTDPQRIKLVPRPTVDTVTAHLAPPNYARALIGEQDVVLQRGAADAGGHELSTTSALIGSQVLLRFEVQGSQLDGKDGVLDWAKVLPGLAGQPGAAFKYDRQAIEARFTLRRTVQSRIVLKDVYGHLNLSEHEYRLEAVVDQLPTVSITAPATDESVLATAVVPISAASRDDVGLEGLAIEAHWQNRDPPPGKDPSGKGPSTDEKTEVLAEITGRRAQMVLNHELDLGKYEPRPGQHVMLYATTRDVYELDANRHDPVRSTARTLHIIDDATLIEEIRGELAALRRSAIRLENRQIQLAQQPPQKLGPQQEQLTRRIETQRAFVGSLVDRINRNRLKGDAAAPLHEMMQQSDTLLGLAAQSSMQAAQRLEQADQQRDKDSNRAERQTEQARRQQEQAAEKLSQLSRMLDQSGDVLTLRSQLQAIYKQQTDLAEDTRRQLPRTLGQKPEQLGDADREKIKQLADRQQSLKEESKSLVKRMQSMAQVLSRQSTEPSDQAAAGALSDAAALAQRQGLAEQMQNAGELTRGNKLSQAAGQQEQSAAVVQQMLEKLDEQQRREQEVLRRQLLKLAQAIEKLILQQKRQLERMAQAEALPPLVDALGTLWRNTLSVTAQAQQASDTKSVAELLGQAAEQQALAVTALHNQQRDEAGKSENQSLTKLEEALKLVRDMRGDQVEQENHRQRDEMRRRYQQLAARQRNLHDKTKPFAGLEELSRRAQAAVRRIGLAESDLRNDADELRQKVAQTIVFLHLHGRIEAVATGLADRMRHGESGPRDLIDQRLIAAMLEAMAEALKRDDQDEPFASSRAQGGGGGGGGRSGGGALVPPVVELKLLRGVQQVIYEQTKFAATLDRIPDADLHNRRLQQLSTDQRDLAGLGRRLIEKMQRGSTTPDDEEPR